MVMLQYHEKVKWAGDLAKMLIEISLRKKNCVLYVSDAEISSMVWDCFSLFFPMKIVIITPGV